MGKKLWERRTFTGEEREIILEKTNGKCGHCGKRYESDKMTIDHIIPLNKGGLNDEYNLVGLCEKCNNEKANFLYAVDDYYRHIKEEYLISYRRYHMYAMCEIEKRKDLIFKHDANRYTIYPMKQRMILTQMLRRGAPQKKVNEMAEKIGVPLYLTNAYGGDAKDIMEFIKSNIENERVHINSSYYENDYAIMNDIANGEVYILRSKANGMENGKIYGVFLFKHINDETISLIQIRNMIETSNLHAKYIMTGAFINEFAQSAFDDIMTDIVRNMIRNGAIPIFFDMLHSIFADVDECISIPYEMDKQQGTIDFMPMKYIRKTMQEDCRSVAKYMNEKLSDLEIELFAEAMINCRTQREIDESDDQTKKLFKEHESLKMLFKPDSYELYGVGFKNNKTRKESYVQNK